MSDKSKIEWTEATWNPVTGCSKVSQGCKNCYAEREWPRMAANPATVYFGRAFTNVQCHPERLDQPLRWKRPRRIFVNSMSDLFHEDVPDSFICDVLNVIDQARQHTFQVLTKRPERMRDFFLGTSGAGANYPPIPNLWLGVSVEDQETAEERIPYLLDTPAAVRWISAEPLLGFISLAHLKLEDDPNYIYVGNRPVNAHINALQGYSTVDGHHRLDWVVAGGETGPGARPTHPDWIRYLQLACSLYEVPFFFKQWGEFIVPEDGAEACRVCGCTWNNACESNCYWAEPGLCSECVGKPTPSGPNRPVKYQRLGKKATGRTLDGRTWDEYPHA